MKIRLLLAVAVVLVNLAPAAFSQTAISVDYHYAPIAFPGAIVTNVNGINNGNVIVGSYFDSEDVVHGFMYRAGKYTAVNFPGATETEVFGINDYDVTVGVYQLPGALNFHGFVQHGNDFASLDDPSAKIGTMAFGINKAGTIVGSYDNAHGFVYENGAFRTLDAPQLAGEPHNTQLNGISNLGWMVGQVFTAGIWRGFWIEEGKLHYIEAAGSTDSQATGVNGHGDLVGCHDSESGFVAFLAGNYDGSKENFPAQQDLASCAAAINYARVIVGSYSSLTNQKGFLAVPVLTLKVTRTPLSSGSLHLAAAAFASGNDPVSQIQVWVNYKEVYHVDGATLNYTVKLPTGGKQRLVVQAVDSNGATVKNVMTVE
jgi:uncharacterized membrane protein